MRKILFAIVVLAAIWAWPAGRTKLVHVLHPILTHLGPVSDKLETPMKKFQAKTEVKAITSGIEHAREEGKDLPDLRTFSAWLRAHPLFDNKDMDPWGNAYYLKGNHPTLMIGSNGPDGVRGNADDITNPVTF